MTISGLSTSSGSSDMDPIHTRGKSDSHKKKVVVAKKGRKPATKKAPMPPCQGESGELPSPKAKRAKKLAPKEAKAVALRLRLLLRQLQRNPRSQHYKWWQWLPSNWLKGRRKMTRNKKKRWTMKRRRILLKKNFTSPQVFLPWGVARLWD